MNIINWGKTPPTQIEYTGNVIIKIASNLLSMHTIVLEDMNGLQAKKAIPFALEHLLLDDIDELEFIIKKHNDAFNVIVIAKEVLENIKEFAKEHKLTIIGVYPEFMFIPFDEEGVSYQIQEDNIIFRDAKFGGGILDKELFFNIFSGHQLKEVTEESSDYNLINLIQLNIREFFNTAVKPWIGVMLLLLMIFAVYFASVIKENITFTHKLEAIQQENTLLFKQNFPEVSKIVDIRAQAERKVRNFNKQKNLQENDLISALLAEKQLPKTIQSLKFDNNTLDIK